LVFLALARLRLAHWKNDSLLTAAEWQAVQLTILVATVAIVATLPPAILIGWMLAKRNFPGKFLVETLINLPLVLPPVVTGYLLLVLFGRNGALGPLLENVFGLRFVFNWTGAALAAAVVAFPLVVRPIRLSFSAIDDRLVQAARTLGAGPLDAFASVMLPLASPGIVSGALLGFARSMGEFGATIMIAGSIPGETRTISLMIYSLLETPDGMHASLRLVWFSIGIAAVALALGELLERRGRRRLQGATA
jgi:molybdate transport system permease protein